MTNEQDKLDLLDRAKYFYWHGPDGQYDEVAVEAIEVAKKYHKIKPLLDEMVKALELVVYHGNNTDEWGYTVKTLLDKIKISEIMRGSE